MGTLSQRNLTRRIVPGLPFARIAKAVLPGWDVSLAFVSSAEAKKLNRSLRGKSYVPNVLSYSPEKRSGEVIICLEEAKRQAPSYGLSYRAFVALLFIHALLHLKGMPHGPTMERRERVIMTRFVSTIHGQKNRDRNRHRKPPGKGGGGRRGTRE